MTRGFAWTFMALGAIAVGVGLGADLLGIGRDEGVGWKQWLAAGLGLALIVAGLLIARSRKP